MTNPLQAVSYTFYIVRAIVTGTLTVALDAFSPGKGVTPMIVELPLECSTDLEITLMASSITITPGTLTLGIAPSDGGTPATLFVHSMYTVRREDTIASLREMEQRLLRMTRGKGGRP